LPNENDDGSRSPERASSGERSDDTTAQTSGNRKRIAAAALTRWNAEVRVLFMDVVTPTCRSGAAAAAGSR
jgi:hypothetical protein